MKVKAIRPLDNNVNYSHGIGKDFFFNWTQIAFTIKEKIAKLDYTTIYNFCSWSFIMRKDIYNKSSYCIKRYM